MKVVILAAGMGSRLKVPNLPKPLTELDNGLTILEWQLQAITKSISVDNVIVVVGYKKEAIQKKLPDLNYIENLNYALENTSKSLLKAIEEIDDDLIWINGDVVFHPDVFSKVFKKDMSSMVVSCGPVGEEEVKYRTDGNGKIIEVSKHVIQGEGEAVGVNRFNKQDIKSLVRELKNCQKSDFFEKAIESCISKGTQVFSIPIDANLCTEVDFPEDLIKANRQLSEWRRCLLEMPRNDSVKEAGD